MIFGISRTKRTVHIIEVSVRRGYAVLKFSVTNGIFFSYLIS